MLKDNEMKKGLIARGKAVPLAKFLGFKIDEINEGSAVMSLDMKEEFKQYAGTMHGGIIATLADSAAAFAVISLFTPDIKLTTIDLFITYFSPMGGNRLIAKADVVKKGKRVNIVDVFLEDESGKAIAKSVVTYMLLQDS